jgi:hypothetical protein
VSAVQGQAAGCLDIRPSRSPGGRFCNTAGLSGELSVGDVVAVGEVPLAVARLGWTLVRGGLNEARTDEHGTHPLPAVSPAWGSRSNGTEGDQHL